MATAAESQLYPLSTDKGTTIPLDIIRPAGAIKWVVSPNTNVAITIPASYGLVSLMSTVDVVLDFSATLTYPILDGSNMPESIIILANMVMTLALPSTGPARLIPCNTAESGILYMNNFQKWAGVGLSRQLNTR